MIVKEHHLNMKMVLQKLRYSEHNWAICVDFKMVNFLLEQQGGTPNTLVFSVTGTIVVVGLPLLFLGLEVWREQQYRFTPST